MNNWIGIGRATKDVEKHTTANGSAVARFSIAVDRKQKNADGERITDFISVVAFGKIAEIAEQLDFCDQFYFSRFFRQRQGETPSRYRRALKTQL